MTRDLQVYLKISINTKEGNNGGTEGKIHKTYRKLIAKWQVYIQSYS